MKDYNYEQLREMALDCLDEHGLEEADCEFDIQEAIYWIAYEWHRGQTTNLYEVLCQSPFKPGPTAEGAEPGSTAWLIMDHIEAADEYERDIAEHLAD